MTHICVSKQSIIASDNSLSPGRRQAIIGTNAGILSIRTLGTNFSEILNEILTFSFKKMCLKVSSAKWRPFCLGLNELSGRSRLMWFLSMYPPVAGGSPSQVVSYAENVPVLWGHRDYTLKLIISICIVDVIPVTLTVMGKFILKYNCALTFSVQLCCFPFFLNCAYYLYNALFYKKYLHYMYLCFSRRITFISIKKR